MPKGKGGRGGKSRRQTNRSDQAGSVKDLITKDEGQEYARVLKMLGNGRVEAKCMDGKTRLCQIRGKMHKKIWIEPKDLILVSLRAFQDTKGDVLLKYSPAEERRLRIGGHLIELGAEGEKDQHGGSDEEEDCAFDFAEI